MHVTLFGVVLFLHITVALVAFGMAGVMHTALNVVARGRSIAELRPWAAVMHRIEPLFPVMALLLLALGAWLVHLGKHTDDAFSFSTGWILTSIITLVAVEAAGGAVLAPHGKKLTRLVNDAPDGAVSDDVMAAARRPLFWDLAHLTTFGFIGVVFLMAAKPSAGWAPVFPIAGAVIGVVLSRLQLAALPAADGSATVPGQRRAEQPEEARS